MRIYKLIKQEIFITIFSVGLITILFFSFSYAFFFQVNEGTKNTISFGNIALSLCADSSCNTLSDSVGDIIGIETVDGVTSLKKYYPVTDSVGLSTEPYRFILKNTGDKDLYLTIKLTADTTFSATESYENEYSNYINTNTSYIKVALGEQGTTPTTKLFSSLTNNILADNITLKAGASKVYELYAWVKSDAPNSLMGTYFISRISVTGEYKI